MASHECRMCGDRVAVESAGSWVGRWVYWKQADSEAWSHLADLIDRGDMAAVTSFFEDYDWIGSGTQTDYETHVDTYIAPLFTNDPSSTYAKQVRNMLQGFIQTKIKYDNDNAEWGQSSRDIGNFSFGYALGSWG